jgi:hypothetical protein
VNCKPLCCSLYCSDRLWRVIFDYTLWRCHLVICYMIFRPRHSSSGQSLASHRCGPGSIPGLVKRDLWWNKWRLGSEYFGFPCQYSFHQLLHNHPHLSSGAGTMGQKWPQCKGLSPTPLAIKKYMIFPSSNRFCFVQDLVGNFSHGTWYVWTHGYVRFWFVIFVIVLEIVLIRDHLNYRHDFFSSTFIHSVVLK